MPFPNFHAARLKAPSQFERFTTQKNEGGDGVDFILGIRADGGSEIQAIRFDRTKFTPAEARKWLADHDFSPILFEEATGEEATQEARHTAPMNADGSCPSGFTKRGGICVRTSTMRESGHLDDGDGEPRNVRGLTVAEEFLQLEERGAKLSQEEANYVVPSPDPNVVCGACRFYLRNPDGSEVGACQVVDGPIAWFGTSDLYISASDEARAVFARQGERAVESIFESIRPAFGSPGGKKILAQTIAGMIPEHKLYVEPFAGAAAVFFAKEPSDFEVLNDNDAEIAEALRFIQDSGKQDWDALLRLPLERDREIFDRLKAAAPDSPVEKFHRFLYLNAFSASSTRTSFSEGSKRTLERKIGRLERLRARLHRAKIMSKDFREAIDEHDGKGTFFYLDPPYPTQQGPQKTDLTTADLMAAVKKIKGKFILSLPDDQETRETFKGFDVVRVNVRRTMNMANPHVDSELLIANFIISSQIDLSLDNVDRIAASVEYVVREQIGEIDHGFLEALPDGGETYWTERERLQKITSK